MTLPYVLQTPPQPKAQEVSAPARARARVNPWQRALAWMALAPALIALGLFLVAMLTQDEYVRLADLSAGSGALATAGALALMWLLAGAINWQIREAARAQSR